MRIIAAPKGGAQRLRIDLSRCAGQGRDPQARTKESRGASFIRGQMGVLVSEDRFVGPGQGGGRQGVGGGAVGDEPDRRVDIQQGVDHGGGALADLVLSVGGGEPPVEAVQGLQAVDGQMGDLQVQLNDLMGWPDESRASFELGSYLFDPSVEKS